VVYAPFSLAVARLHCIARWAARCAAMQWYDSAFRVCRILGGGKIRQTLCVLFLAKILNKEALFILRRPKNLKGIYNTLLNNAYKFCNYPEIILRDVFEHNIFKVFVIGG